MKSKTTYNSEKYFYHNDELYSMFNYSLINGNLIIHNLGEIPHTIDIEVEEDGSKWAIIRANFLKSYCQKLVTTKNQNK